jgi:hypothetical protein
MEAGIREQEKSSEPNRPTHLLPTPPDSPPQSRRENDTTKCNAIDAKATIRPRFAEQLTRPSADLFIQVEDTGQGSDLESINSMLLGNGFAPFETIPGWTDTKVKLEEILTQFSRFESVACPMC